MKIELLIISIINYISYTNSQTTCQVYKCVNSLIDNTCLKRDPDGKTVNLQTCDAPKFCDFSSDYTTSECLANVYHTDQFIGGPCNGNSDCKQGNCKDSICTPADKSCQNNTDCGIGKYCENKLCFQQLKAGETCQKNQDCVNNCGCSSKNKCVEYFTLEDGDELSEEDTNYFCKSGFALDGVCRTKADLKSNQLCTGTNKCVYTITNGTDIESFKACKCGKNLNGDKYCKSGTDSTKFKIHLELIKSYTNETMCHTTERFQPCVINAFDKAGEKNTHKSFDFKKKLRDFHNQILVNNDEFTNVTLDSCILPVLGQYDRNFITPDSILKCPSYQCGSEKVCAKSNNPNLFDSSNVTVTLTKGVCTKDQTCEISDSKSIYFNSTRDFPCSTQISTKTKYSGETCSQNDECLNAKCESGSCKFIELEKECNPLDPLIYCGLNSFCFTNSTTSKSSCVKQSEKDQVCSSTYQCKNNLVCYDGKCSLEYGSLDEKFDFDLMKFTPDFVQYELLCKSLEFTKTKKKCHTYSYNNTADSNGYVSCNRTVLGEDCVYKTSLNETLTYSCDCGFNADGKSYCPVDFSKRKIY